MDTLSPIRTVALAALLLTGTALMGCGTSITGPEAPSGEQVTQPEEPTFSTGGGDAEENNPI